MSDEPRPEGPPPEEEYAQHLRAILEQEARIRAADAAPQETRSPLLARIPVVVIVSLLFSTVVAHNIRAWTPDPVPQTEATQERVAHLSLLVAAQRIEVFRRENGRLPESLAEAGIQEDAFVYLVEGDGYQLQPSGEPGENGRPIYDSEAGPGEVVRILTEAIPVDG